MPSASIMRGEACGGTAHAGGGGTMPAGGERRAASPHRLLIVDDSAVARAVIERIVTATGRYAVVASVSSVAAAHAVLAREPVDLILLDVHLPDVDGISALPDLAAAGRRARILVVSSAAGDGAETSVRALAMGAADTLFKPSAGERSGQFAPALVDKLDRLSEAGAVRRCVPAASASASAPLPTRPATPAAPPSSPPRASPGSWRPVANDGTGFDVVAIGASTGGIHALSHLLRAVPGDFLPPILITQHLPPSFMPYFAAQLAVIAGRPCDVATDRLRLRARHIVVAPGDAHMRVVPLADGTAAIRLSTEASQSGCMPSVDPMFASMAVVYGTRVMAIVLSGMGRDGADGAKFVHDAGGCVVVQDQASSVVWGMPGAVAEIGCMDAMLSPDAIGRLVARRERP